MNRKADIFDGDHVRRSGFILIAVALALVSMGSQAKAASLSDKPWSVGLGVGFLTYGPVAAFAMEVPVEYTFKIGPGELAPHFGLQLGATAGYTQIGLPLGIRYKFRLIKQPLYLGPFVDVGPSFLVSGGVGGFVKFGEILSYLVHPNVELIFQPLGLGAGFGARGAAFVYNLLLGSNFRF